MPKTKLEKNIEYLKNIPKLNAPDANKSKIKDIIELYKDKYINNVKQATNAIQLLASRHKSQLKKALDNYNKLMDLKIKDYLIDLFLYHEPTEEEVKANPKIKLWRHLKMVHHGNHVIQPALTFRDALRNPKQEIINDHGSIDNFLNKHIKQLLTISRKALGREPTDEEETTFKNMEYLIRTDNDIQLMYDAWGLDYIHGIYYSKITPLDKNAPKYNPYKSKKRDASKISTYFRYLSTEVDLTQSNFKDAINKYTINKDDYLINEYCEFGKSENNFTIENIFNFIDKINNKVKDMDKHCYIRNECWINTLYDVYKDNLLSSDKNEM
jgi:hypothetical protein